ncbi:MBL fold metallo-hydrolase [Nitrospirillum amazonense]|uniref:Glyoxylase-like metal-dependent hydrolase (Beta-lactamase superfamily II) n=1 Tax=Nitrospirillum amazonense TaxID=28077 RepID=A0A560KEH1_9PROT|nr:MBL fold metallo-hydrolase [Nitrospirillum amazonense]MDG3441162.1 MBL fold metallo-hydrolase [Nitrospirillum amazonense]TWB80344.1 glyoxylase-like metal-dependent hydrolase (beta-lactamase superfamily II) [Nitrospirillum amazonense]
MAQAIEGGNALLARMRRRPINSTLIGLAIVLMVALLSFAWTFAPIRLDVPQVDVGALPSATPPAAMSISVMPTGTYETPAALAFRGGSWSEKRAFAASGVLVRHPKGNLLIDTGFGRNVEQQLKLLPSLQQSPHHLGTPIIDQLAGVQADTITAIIPTHAHWDHISGVDDFHGIPVLVDDAGQRFIDSHGEGTEVLNSFHAVSYQAYHFDGGAYLGFPSSHDVYGDGSVVIVPAPGHTPDSVVVFVNLPSGKRYAFVGDLVWQMEGLARPAEKPWMMRFLIGENRSEIQTAIARIRAATALYPQITAVPAHDGRAFSSIAVYPASTR